MKNLINLFIATVILMNITNAQIPTSVVQLMMEIEEEKTEIAAFDPYHEIELGLPIRVINHKKADRIFIQPEVVLSEATLNIIDQDGNSLIAYHFDRLSEIDLSVKSLPAGDYTLNLHSDQGSTSHKVVR